MAPLSAEPETLPARPPGHGPAWGPAATAAILVVPAVVVIGIFAAPFLDDPTTLPFGRDTGSYLWRSNVAQEIGIDELGDRPGHPLVIAILRTLSGVEPLEGAWIVPGVLAAAIGLAAGVVAVDVLGGRRWFAIAAAIGLGSSAFVAWTAVGYAANLLFDVVGVALVVVLVRVMADRPGSAPAAALLLGAGAAIHWMFTAVLASVFATAAIAFALVTRRHGGRRRGRPWYPALILGLGVALGMLVLVLAPAFPSELPDVDPRHVAAFIDERISAFWLPVVVPLALVALALGLRDHRRRWGVIVVGAWASLAGTSVVAWSVLDLPTPPYRWVGFALGLPLLAALAGPWIADRWSPPGGVLGVVVAVIALIPAGVLAVGGARVWWSQEPRLDREVFAQLATVTSYLERHVPPATPVIVSIDPDRGSEPVGATRAGLPGARAPSATAQRIGYPRDGAPVVEPAHAVVVHLSALRSGRPPVGELLGPGVWLVRGPAPRAPVGAGPPVAPDIAGFLGGSAAWLAILGSAGVGFTRPLGLRWGARLALAPAFGVAALVLTGVLAGRFGIRPGGWGAVGIFLVATATGHVSAMVQRRATGTPPADRSGAAG